MVLNCRICGNDQGNRTHRAREMMFGTRDEFEYVECARCGTVQIASIPELSPYYPAEYYSLDQSRRPEIERSWRRRAAAHFLGKHLLGGRTLIGRYVDKRRPQLRGHFPSSLVDPILDLDLNSSILDVGCGSGQLLRTLHAFGFRNLAGTDAFIERDFTVHGRIAVRKLSIDQLDGRFDLVMLHHSFEHLPEATNSLSKLKDLLKPYGTLLIRMPVVAYAWEQYGINWVQLDAPRHLHLFTEQGFRMIAGQLGFDLLKVVYDSHAFQFFGSEQYKMDIPMNDATSFAGASESSIFSQDQIDEWSRLSEKLNTASRGDQACFYLRST